MLSLRTTRGAAIVLASWAVLFAAHAAAANDPLALAKDLYASAAYEEALTVLAQVDHAPESEAVEVDVYRAFCFLALGRVDEGRKAMQKIVEANPSFHPSDAQMSPRLVDAFRDVRRQVLPSIVRQTYTEARAAFDRKDTAVARRQFTRTMELLNDADLSESHELGDLRMLSTGFLDLIAVSQVTPQPAPVSAAPQLIASPLIPSIYDDTDPRIRPPVAVSQPYPSWRRPKEDARSHGGTLSVVIDENGDVIAASTQGDLLSYDVPLTRAAQSWKFRPATKDGVPVKYRKVIAIHLTATGSDGVRP
jgi:hypothetical protein